MRRLDLLNLSNLNFVPSLLSKAKRVSTAAINLIHEKLRQQATTNTTFRQATRTSYLSVEKAENQWHKYSLERNNNFLRELFTSI